MCENTTLLVSFANIEDISLGLLWDLDFNTLCCSVVYCKNHKKSNPPKSMIKLGKELFL